MDILKMIAELRAEREAIEEALVVLERLASNRGRRRGRPPRWMTAISQASDVAEAEGGERTPRVFSAETRRKMAEAQTRRWAAFRKAQQA